MSLIVDFPSQRTLPASSHSVVEPLRVTFSEEIEVTHVVDVSAKYKSSLFYTGQQMRDFKRVTAQEMRRMQVNSMTQPDYEEYLCSQDTTEFLGLESCLCHKSYRDILARRKILRTAIKNEQARQSELGIQDSDAIANVSLVNTEWSRRRARTVALLHAGSVGDRRKYSQSHDSQCSVDRVLQVEANPKRKLIDLHEGCLVESNT